MTEVISIPQWDSRLAGTSLSDALRLHTAAAHGVAERTGIVREILRGRVSRFGYASFMRNLLPAYQALEAGLRTHAAQAGVRLIARPELYRSDAIAADLTVLAGADRAETLALLPSGIAYGAQVHRAACTDPALLIGHAYTRCMGDLSGAQFLVRSLARAPRLEPAALSFYRFDAIFDHGAFKAGYRRALDAAGCEVADPAAILCEAALAFACNIAVSVAVLEANPG